MRVLVAIVLVGCGRLSFDASADAQPPFCATHPALFCSELTTMDPWMAGPLVDGSYELTDGTLHASSTVVQAGDGAEAFLLYPLGVTGTRVRESAAVRIDATGQGEPVLFQVRLTTPTSIHGVEYVYRAPPSMAYIEEFLDPRDGNAVVYVPYLLAPPPTPVGQWSRIDLELDVTAPHAVVRYDDTIALDQPLMWSDAGDARIEVGIVYVKGPATGWDARFDNVLGDAN